MLNISYLSLWSTPCCSPLCSGSRGLTVYGLFNRASFPVASGCVEPMAASTQNLKGRERKRSKSGFLSAFSARPLFSSGYIILLRAQLLVSASLLRCRCHWVPVITPISPSVKTHNIFPLMLALRCFTESCWFSLTLPKLLQTISLLNSFLPTLLNVRFLCPPPSPGVCSNSWPLSQWYYPTTSFSAALLSFCFNLSQHHGLFQWIGSFHQVAKGLELQLQRQFFQWIFRVNFL